MTSSCVTHECDPECDPDSSSLSEPSLPFRFGKPVMQPREICYMAESADLGYKYSGTEMVVELFDDFPEVLRLKVCAHCALPHLFYVLLPT